MKLRRFTVISSLMYATMLTANPAFAEIDAATAKQIGRMEQEIKQLQSELATLKKGAAKTKTAAKTSTRGAKTDTAAAASTPQETAALTSPIAEKAVDTASDSPSGVVVTNKNNIKLTLGGFIEAAGIARTRSESTDISSNFSTGIPYPYQPGSHLSEFRETARQSRLSLLAQGAADPDTNLSAYFEGDFLGAGVNSNSNETNSYTPRIRQLFAQIDTTDWGGTHVLAGQAWSLITLNKQGIVARQENVPLTIEAQYVPGFTFTRNPQLRMVKDFADEKLTFGLSLESPQALVNNSTPNAYSGGTPITGLTGSGALNTTAYSLDLAPDIIAKMAWDPSFGHYEIYGLARFFRDRNNSLNSTIMGGGAGAGAILPLIDKKLEFQISGLAGTGIGRYGASQLPDVTLKSDGGLATIDEAQLLTGLTAHPDEHWDLYLYGGLEEARKRAFTNAAGTLGYGYGSPLYNNSGCDSLAGTAATCVANTKTVAQVTAGAWWKFYKGNFGTMQAGIQDSFTKRYIFTGTGGAPGTNDNITMISLRYYPF